MARVCVAGAGVIGSLFAAHLARVAEVSALTRREEHADALRSTGLRVSGRADFTAQLTAATSPDDLPAPELVILACKGTDLDAVAARLAGHWPDATVMTVQNGIGADEVVARHGDWRILAAVTFMSGTRHEDTHVQYVLDTATWIGPARGTTYADAQCGRGADRLVGAQGRGVRGPAPGAVVEADLQRDRQHRRRADRAAARPALRRARAAGRPRPSRARADGRGQGRRRRGGRASSARTRGR